MTKLYHLTGFVSGVDNVILSHIKKLLIKRLNCHVKLI